MARIILGLSIIVILLITSVRFSNADPSEFYPSQSERTSADQLELDLEQFATGLTRPLGLVNSGIPGDKRLFVVEQAGLIKVLDENGNAD